MNLDEALKAAADLEESRQGSLAADCDLDEGYEPHRSVMDALKFFSEREHLVQKLVLDVEALFDRIDADTPDVLDDIDWLSASRDAVRDFKLE